MAKAKAAPKKVQDPTLMLDIDDLNIILADDAEVVCAFTFGKDIGVVSINTFNGKEALDLRRFYRNDEQDGFIPTPKGIRIPIACAADVVERMAAVVDELRARASK